MSNASVGIREQSGLLVTIGACAAAGGIQALRNYADIGEYTAAVYARPDDIATLATSTPASAHVRVDLQLHGCPIDKGQLLRTLTSLLRGALPRLADGSVCVECKRRGTVCLLVGRGVPCVGPVTRAGCGALCPAYDRGCFGCFGPADTVNLEALRAQLAANGTSEAAIDRLLSTFAVAAFREVAR